MSEELEKALELYRQTFDDAFPTIPFIGTEEKEVIRIIQECVDAKKDVYDMKHLSLDEIY